MGLQEPLTAMALGRSPYDEVIEGTGSGTKDASTSAEDHVEQQYDARGRAINPSSKKLMRDVVRAHNEVMLVIGVAEPENPTVGPEVEAYRRHQQYEQDIGSPLEQVASRCVQLVGGFGITGARQRILVYQKYSHIKFWEMFSQARRGFTMSTMIWPGVPSFLVRGLVEYEVSRRWPYYDGWGKVRAAPIAHRLINEIWSYIRVHLELYSALQRIGIIDSRKWFPSLSFLIPFTSESVIRATPLPETFTARSIGGWALNVFANATPFLLWIAFRKLGQDWMVKLWPKIYSRLPTTSIRPKTVPPPSALPPPPPPAAAPGAGAATQPQTPDGSPPDPFYQHQDSNLESMDPEWTSNHLHDDEGATDDEDNGGLSATLISFDVEATDATDPPPGGLWSAELRPSAVPDTKPQQPVYLDTKLTSFPPRLAAMILTTSLVRVLVAPFEASALRSVARLFLDRAGLPFDHVLPIHYWSGGMTAIVNLLSVEFLNFSLTVEIWTAALQLARWFHKTEAEFEDYEIEQSLDAIQREEAASRGQ